MPGQPISAPLEHSQLVLDLAGGHRHELTENMHSDLAPKSLGVGPGAVASRIRPHARINGKVKQPVNNRTGRFVPKSR